jgi:DNA repair exonuclease SbcCD ATPase subunit
MATDDQQFGTATVEVANVGGIEDASVDLPPGVTVLSGRNATNRTSLLRAIMTACGSSELPLKSDAESGEVELAFDGETSSRTLTRQGDTVVAGGDPYLDDPTLADLFAFLLESNEARRAVTRSDDLRSLIMRPVDTDEIQAEIERLMERRRAIDEELDAIESLKKDLPSLEARRQDLEADIEATRADLESTEADIEAANTSVEEERADQQELEETLEALREKRSALEDVRYDLETERESLERLQEELSERTEALDSLSEMPSGDIDDIESRIEDRRARKQELESELNEIQSAIQFNEEMLDGGAEDLGPSLSGDDRVPDGGPVTDQLLETDQVTCWTCGSEVERDAIETTIDRLQEVSTARRQDIDEIASDLADLQDEREDLRSQQRERDRHERRLSELEREIEEAETRTEALIERRETLTEEIEENEAEVENLEGDTESEVLDLHKEANQHEYELGRLEGDLESVTEEIEEIEARIEEADDLEAERETLAEEITELRTRIERLEEDAIEGFNEHMETVLELLAYDNLERIWLERVERTERQGRRKVETTAFDLHVIRSTDSGTTYEDSIDHLSESEREVTGLVFALAGYLAHEVHEEVPFMLLDSLEAIDAERISTLVDYFKEYSPYLVVALLTEDASQLDDAYTRVSEI